MWNMYKLYIMLNSGVKSEVVRRIVNFGENRVELAVEVKYKVVFWTIKCKNKVFSRCSSAMVLRVLLTKYWMHVTLKCANRKCSIKEERF